MRGPAAGERVGEGARVRADARVRVVEGIDLTDEVAVASFYAGCPPLWASVHLAGGFRAAPLVETTLRDLQGQLDLNLATTFLCCREAVRAMRAKAPRAGGRIVNVGSRASVRPEGGKVAYAVSKGAVATLTQTLAEELKPEKIQVNAVVPSTIDTAANRAAMPEADFGSWPTAAEVAAAIVWLASPAASVTSGALVPVYGRA